MSPVRGQVWGDCESGHISFSVRIVDPCRMRVRFARFAGIVRAGPRRHHCVHRRHRCVRFGVKRGHVQGPCSMFPRRQCHSFVNSMGLFQGIFGRMRKAWCMTLTKVKGGEQGDPMLPLSSLGQHPALCAVQRRLRRGELIFAFLDDIYVKTSPDRVSQVYAALQEELWRHARIRVHDGKSQVWNSSGTRPEGCDVLDRAARAMDPNFTTVWRGSGVVPAEQGIRILCTPLGHEEYVRHHLDRTIQDHHELLQRIPSVPDVQSAWALLLHCANARTTYSLRVVRPELVMEFARANDAWLWRCMCSILGIVPDQCDALSKDAATLPLSMGGVGLRSAVRTSVPASWASWADSISMIRERHPSVANMIIEALESGPHTPTLAAVAESAHGVFGVQGFEPPS